MLVSLFMEVMVWRRSNKLKLYEHKMHADMPKPPKDKNKSASALSLQAVAANKNGTENPAFTQS